jgi:hypothetical protein
VSLSSFGSRTETLGAVTATSRGTTLTAGASNVMGTAVSLGTTAFPYSTVMVSTGNSSTISADFLVDLMVDDGSSNRWIIAEHLRVPTYRQVALGGVSYILPLSVAASTPLYARCRSNASGPTIDITVTGIAAPLPGISGASRCVPLFTTTASRGFPWDPGAAADTDTGYQQLHAGYNGNVIGWSMCVGNNADSSRTHDVAQIITIGVGASGSQWPLAEKILTYAFGNAHYTPNVFGPFPCDVAPSRAWWIRGMSSDIRAGDRTSDISLYGFVR